MCKYKYVFFECGCFAGRIRDETQPPCGLFPVKDDSDEKQSADGRASDPLPPASGATESQPICKAPPLPFAITAPCGGCPAWRKEGDLEAAVVAGDGKLREASSDGELANRHFSAPAVSCTTAAAPILPATVDAAIRDNVFATKKAERKELAAKNPPMSTRASRSRGFRRSWEKPFETEDAEMVEGGAFNYASRVRPEGVVKERLRMANWFKGERWDIQFERMEAPIMARVKQLLAKADDEKRAWGAAADAALAKGPKSQKRP